MNQAELKRLVIDTYTLHLEDVLAFSGTLYDLSWERAKAVGTPRLRKDKPFNMVKNGGLMHRGELLAEIYISYAYGDYKASLLVRVPVAGAWSETRFVVKERFAGKVQREATFTKFSEAAITYMCALSRFAPNRI